MKRQFSSNDYFKGGSNKELLMLNGDENINQMKLAHNGNENPLLLGNG